MPNARRAKVGIYIGRYLKYSFDLWIYTGIYLHKDWPKSQLFYFPHAACTCNIPTVTETVGTYVGNG